MEISEAEAVIEVVEAIVAEVTSVAVVIFVVGVISAVAVVEEGVGVLQTLARLSSGLPSSLFAAHQTNLILWL